MLKRTLTTILEFGDQRIVLIFLFVYVYLSYYSVTGMSLSQLVRYSDTSKMYLYISLASYLLYGVRILTYVNMKKICAKHKVVVIK